MYGRECVEAEKVEKLMEREGEGRRFVRYDNKICIMANL